MPIAYSKKLFLSAVKLGALIGFSVCLIFLSGLFKYPELTAIDARYRIRGEAAPSEDIVIVGITQRCLNQLGNFPWPRSYHAELIDFLKKAGAKVIAMDIFFPQPSGDQAADQRLAESIKNAGNVILPVFMPYRIPDQESGDNFIRVDNLIESMPAFAAGAAAQAHINMIADDGGVYRRVPIAIKYSEGIFFSLGIEAAIKFLDVQPNQIILEPGYIELQGRRMPLEDSKFIYINFSNLETKNPRFAFSDVIKGLVPAENFKNKIVFVGQTAQGMPNADILQTPFKGKYGLTVQANIANTILQGFNIRRANKYRTCIGIILLCIFTSLIMVCIKTWPSTALALAAFLVLCFSAANIFISTGLIIDIVPLAAAVIFSFAGAILFRIRFADRLVKTKELEVNDLFLNSIRALAGTIDAKDPYTLGHSERVTDDALAIADEIGLDKNQIKEIKVGAILHDIGKIGIRDVILSKPAQLTEEEKELFDQHPDIGSKIMKPISQLEGIIPMIRHHHESYDGNGYPDRLSGDQIPLGARIISVADTFDAMTSDRPYRKALPFLQKRQRPR